MPVPPISVFPKCYVAIFRILRSVNFTGWISVEDGMDGLDELRRSVDFLKKKRAQYFDAPDPRP